MFAQSGVAILIALVLGGLLRRYWRPFLRHWTWSWVALAAHTGAGAGALVLAQWRPITDPARLTLALVSGIAGYLQIAWLLSTKASVDTYTANRERVT
ncbi:MAG: hypothetical protein ABI969_16865, partial [bacterium]